MLRSLQAVLCAAFLFVFVGCKQEVKEIPPAEKNNTPKVTDEERQKVLDAENKRNEEAAKQRKADAEKAAGKKKS